MFTEATLLNLGVFEKKKKIETNQKSVLISLVVRYKLPCAFLTFFCTSVAAEHDVSLKMKYLKNYLITRTAT